MDQRAVVGVAADGATSVLSTVLFADIVVDSTLAAMGEHARDVLSDTTGGSATS